MCLPAEDLVDLMNSINPTSQISLNRLRSFTDNSSSELRVLIGKAIESLEEAREEVLKASLDNDTTALRASVHKITPLLHYLQADKVMDIISCCVQCILRSTSQEECNVHYQLILKKITGTLSDLNESVAREGL